MKFTHRHFDWLLYRLAWPEFREKLLQGDMRLWPEATYYCTVYADIAG